MQYYKGRTPAKKNVFFRALPEKGGGRPMPNFFTLFHQLHFLSIKRVYFLKNANITNFELFLSGTSCPNWVEGGMGGGRGNSGNVRKKTFFLREVFHKIKCHRIQTGEFLSENIIIGSRGVPSPPFLAQMAFTQ